MSIESIAVVGCGQMGLGVIEAIAGAGYDVVALRATGGDPSRARAALGRAVARKVERGVLDPDVADMLLGRVRFETGLAAVSECDLVVESGLEDLEEKKRLLQDLERHMSAGAVLATNTSSLPLAALADALRRPAQLCGMQFFMPAPRMQLVEIAYTDRTAPGVVASAERFCRAIGKTPVTVPATPGYVVNRLLLPTILHAIELLETGVADAEAIDDAMRLGCGHPMGPLALADLIGLDVVAATAAALYTELGDARYRLPSLLRRLLVAQHLGRKTGAGFYEYGPGGPRRNPAIQLRPHVVCDAAE